MAAGTGKAEVLQFQKYPSYGPPGGLTKANFKKQTWEHVHAKKQCSIGSSKHVMSICSFNTGFRTEEHQQFNVRMFANVLSFSFPNLVFFCFGGVFVRFDIHLIIAILLVSR